MEPSFVFSTKTLPSGPSVTFRDSSFFLRNGHDAVLPSPSEVLAKSLEQSPEQGPPDQYWRFRPPVYYEELGLLVKYGFDPKVTVAEGQCLWALRQAALPHVPVPEIYGWTKDEHYTYLYMELVHATPLDKLWVSLSREERIHICAQLRSMLNELRSIGRDPDEHFVGDISRGPLADIVLADSVKPRAGPFANVKEFNDWTSWLVKRGCGQHWPGIEEKDLHDPWRKGLPDDAKVVFTHADLHPSNIFISSDKPHNIVSIIDWQQSGWYPDYWEFCKAAYTADYKSEWMQEYVPRFVDEPSCFGTFGLYTYAYGC